MMDAVVHFLPEDKKVKVRRGTTVFQAARQAKVHIRSRCGQKAGCLMCKVRVDDQRGLAPMNPREKLKLGISPQTNMRLSCQSVVTGDVTVIVPEDPLRAAVRALLDKQREED